jgi:hypothetical protein
VTGEQALPWIFLAAVAVILVLCLAKVPLQIAGNLVQTLAMIIAYTHAEGGGDYNYEDYYED